MMDTWQLQEAKNRFSEVVKKALANGPQVVTKRGEETVIILSAKEYRKLTQPRNSLVDFFSRSPLQGANFDLERSTDPPREVEL